MHGWQVTGAWSTGHMGRTEEFIVLTETTEPEEIRVQAYAALVIAAVSATPAGDKLELELIGWQPTAKIATVVRT